MKFMTNLENIIMNRTGCNRETANLVANDILRECESTMVPVIKIETTEEIFEKIRRESFPHYDFGVSVVLMADLDRVEREYKEELTNDEPKNT